MTPRLAVLDDEPRMAEVLAMVLRREGYDVDVFTRPRAALAALDARPYDLLLTDLRMPGMDGIAVLTEAVARQPGLPVVVITAHGTVGTAIDAMKRGAVDYVQKPFDNDAVRALVARALELTRLRRENRFLRARVRDADGAVAESAAMVRVLELARRAAAGRSPVLISGASGTGKEVVARHVHVHSDRVGGPFVAVNCGAFAEGVLESELFGHERGAFTGADRARTGLFEQAHRGTLFLDEIGETDARFQTRLLRVLQEGEVRRVGASEAVSVDVRVIAASNRDLRAEVASRRFREDLYFRLAVIPIDLPPLSERPEDVLPLARHFLASLGSGGAVRGWSDEVEHWLVAHPWPGNVRELRNAIERGLVLARGDRIELEDLVLDTEAPAASPRGGTLREVVDQATAERIRAALREAGGVRVDAARALGVDRTTLYRLMQRYDIEG